MDNRKFALGVLFGLGLAAIVGLGFSVFQSVQDSAFLSCISSAEDRLTNALRLAESKEEISLGHEWRSLTDFEVGILFGKFENGPGFDCARFDYINEGRNDEAQRLGIRGRKINNEVELKLTGLGWVRRYE